MYPCRCFVFQNGVRDEKLIIHLIHTKTPDAVKKISEMKLPINDWETMEQEIESGAVNE